MHDAANDAISNCQKAETCTNHNDMNGLAKVNIWMYKR